MPDDYFAQPYPVRFDWGWRGCREAAARGHVVVVVDVLRFSTAVVTAASRGIIVVPASDADDLDGMCRRHDARRVEQPLLPATYESLPPGSRVIVRSPNGATCVRLAAGAGRSPAVLVGALVNASAVAARVNRLLRDGTTSGVTVIACGERWAAPADDDDGPLRVAIEDLLGAGAILSRIDGELSPEARLCALTYRASEGELLDLLLGCGSGRERVALGDRASVERAAEVDRYDVVPVLRDGCLVAG